MKFVFQNADYTKEKTPELKNILKNNITVTAGIHQNPIFKCPDKFGLLETFYNFLFFFLRLQFSFKKLMFFTFSQYECAML
jgi:hypothetical protein